MDDYHVDQRADLILDRLKQAGVTMVYLEFNCHADDHESCSFIDHPQIYTQQVPEEIDPDYITPVSFFRAQHKKDGGVLWTAGLSPVYWTEWRFLRETQATNDVELYSISVEELLKDFACAHLPNEWHLKSASCVGTLTIDVLRESMLIQADILKQEKRNQVIDYNNPLRKNSCREL